MNAQRTLLAAMVWTLLLAPTACMSGLLPHHCAPCAEVCEGHEVDCHEDPCNLQLPPMSQFRFDEPISKAGFVLVDSPALTGKSMPPENPGFELVSQPPGLRNLHPPVSDLPLLC